MATSSTVEESYLETFEVSASTASSIHVSWLVQASIKPLVKGYQIHYQKVASTYIQYGPILRPSDNEYQIANLVADTYYKVCLTILRNDTSPFRKCTDASTTNWQLPVSIGSSIGAVLALSVIVIIVLLSRCRFALHYKKSKRSSKYDTISSAFHDDQFDFSETVTHGIDDEFVSEFDHDDESCYEIPQQESKCHRQFYSEKAAALPNGLGRGQAHPHSHSFSYSQPRNSFCRVSYSQHADHGRQLRAHSIQSDANMSFFNRPYPNFATEHRKHSAGIEDIDHEDSFAYSETLHSSNTAVPAFIDNYSLLQENQTPTQKLCSRQTQAISFIDEITEVSSLSKCDNATTDLQDEVTPENLLIIEPHQFNDISVFAASGCTAMPGSCDSDKQIELKPKMVEISESISFEEHTV